jgi:hypothetical protein
MNDALFEAAERRVDFKICMINSRIVIVAANFCKRKMWF